MDSDLMTRNDLRELLDHLYEKYNSPDFIEDDPISVPHMFEGREDREIAGFLAATIAWGNRKAIVKSGRRMVEFMDGRPYDFTMNASASELEALEKYVHRTFNGRDFRDFILALRRLYEDFGGLGGFFQDKYEESRDIRVVLSAFRREFFGRGHDPHCEKHISAIDKKAGCKRLNMYLRWMVRDDGRGVDFGIWKKIPSSALYLPLDVHSGNMGRSLGLLSRRQDDWKAVEEITSSLREFDPSDPVKYDFALFGAGIDGFLKK